MSSPNDATPRDREEPDAPGVAARLGSYRVIYLAVAVFAVLYVFTVKAAEQALGRFFEQRVEESLHVDRFDEAVSVQIQRRIEADVKRSPWVRIGGVRVGVIAIGRDGRTLIYGGGPTPAPPDAFDLMNNLREAERLLPATAQVSVALPHNTVLSNAILLVYAAALIQGLFFYNRLSLRREREELELALSDRDAAAERAAHIEGELEGVRRRLLAVEPAEREQADEIATLRGERQRLQSQLAALVAREEELRGKAARAVELDQERRSLEDLLDEAAHDLAQRDDAIRDLEQRLTKAAKRTRAESSARARDVEALSRRLRTLYKNLEFDDRAIDAIVALGDESLRLKCEENLKRLDDDAENVAVRRKVGGLPNHLAVFELSFAGKGRIYYSKGQQRRFRVRLVGGKASQTDDLDTLRKLDE
ncbi:MAG: hypothetical protein KC560_20225 [Myxococcales bacterium]|nr:hypothetical protein [Myxococcales bacterium]